jgi:hypothetical protein
MRFEGHGFSRDARQAMELRALQTAEKPLLCCDKSQGTTSVVP